MESFASPNESSQCFCYTHCHPSCSDLVQFKQLHRADNQWDRHIQTTTTAVLFFPYNHIKLQYISVKVFRDAPEIHQVHAKDSSKNAVIKYLTLSKPYKR